MSSYPLLLSTLQPYYNSLRHDKGVLVFTLVYSADSSDLLIVLTNDYRAMQVSTN